MAQISGKKRKKIKSGLAMALHEKISGLPNELREILLDDLVTAIENRLNVMLAVQTKDTIVYFEQEAPILMKT